jgi:hypothetical protein
MRATLVALVVLCNCAGGQPDPRTQRALDVFECRARVLAPYVGDIADARDLVRDIAKGQVDAGRFMAVLGHGSEAMSAMLVAWEDCAPPVAPIASPRSLAFREPPY